MFVVYVGVNLPTISWEMSYLIGVFVEEILCTNCTKNLTTKRISAQVVQYMMI